MPTPITALGLMSGTSLDGIDAAILTTDGENAVRPGPALTAPYAPETRALIQAAIAAARAGDPLGPPPSAALEAERALTLAHAEAVRRLLAEAGLGQADVDVIGFHGQTVLHAPERRRTVQLGDGALLARETGIDVVFDFRTADVAAGGQGAPLAPAYHRALAGGVAERPLAILNIGGVANVTFVGGSGIGPEGEPIAFDTGPGNGLLDDWAALHTARPMDANGTLARSGRVWNDLLGALLANRYFDAPPPKSLDRHDFTLGPLRGLSPGDGAATLTAFTAGAVALAVQHLPASPARWLVCGGGRRNPALMTALRRRLGRVEPVEAVGWRGDFLEAEAFAYLAVRSLRGLPLSWPGTTGAPAPMTGGRVCRASGGV